MSASESAADSSTASAAATTTSQPTTMRFTSQYPTPPQLPSPQRHPQQLAYTPSAYYTYNPTPTHSQPNTPPHTGGSAFFPPTYLSGYPSAASMYASAQSSPAMHQFNPYQAHFQQFWTTQTAAAAAAAAAAASANGHLPPMAPTTTHAQYSMHPPQSQLYTQMQPPHTQQQTMQPSASPTLTAVSTSPTITASQIPLPSIYQTTNQPSAHNNNTTTAASNPSPGGDEDSSAGFQPVKHKRPHAATKKTPPSTAPTTVNKPPSSPALPAPDQLPQRSTSGTNSNLQPNDAIGKRGHWTPDEDDRLRKAVEEYNARNWKRIAETAFGDRKTDVQCLHRWQKVLKPGLVKGPWTKEEDATVVRLVQELGLKKWSQIASHLQGRLGKQCRERWFNHLDPNIKKEPWTPQEDQMIVEAHAELGNKWALIAQRIPGRTDNSIKNRWNSTLQRLIQKGLPFSAIDYEAQGDDLGAQTIKQQPDDELDDEDDDAMDNNMSVQQAAIEASNVPDTLIEHAAAVASASSDPSATDPSSANYNDLPSIQRRRFLMGKQSSTKRPKLEQATALPTASYFPPDIANSSIAEFHHQRQLGIPLIPKLEPNTAGTPAHAAPYTNKPHTPTGSVLTHLTAAQLADHVSPFVVRQRPSSAATSPSTVNGRVTARYESTIQSTPLILAHGSQRYAPSPIKVVPDYSTVNIPITPAEAAATIQKPNLAVTTETSNTSAQASAATPSSDISTPRALDANNPSTIEPTAPITDKPTVAPGTPSKRVVGVDYPPPATISPHRSKNVIAPTPLSVASNGTAQSVLTPRRAALIRPQTFVKLPPMAELSTDRLLMFDGLNDASQRDPLFVDAERLLQNAQQVQAMHATALQW